MNKTFIYNENFSLENREELIIDHIIDSIHALLPGDLCAINENSEKLFYDFLKISHVDCSAFSYNWPYIIQATRKRGFFYQNKQSIVYFYLRKSANNFLQPYTLIVVNHLGYDAAISVCAIAEAAKKLGIATIVKNIDQDKIPFWNGLGFQETVEPWSRYSFRDDNTFPEFIYDVKKILRLDFNNRTKRIINKILKEKEYLFVPYDDSFKNIGLKLLEDNSEYLENKGVDFKHEVILAHKFVFDDSIKNKIVFAILENNRLVAISFLTHVEKNLFFNAIINENKSNLMRFLLWKSVANYCLSLEEDKRPLYLSLQGSEREGQNKWKSFFHPIRTICRTHVTNKN